MDQILSVHHPGQYIRAWLMAGRRLGETLSPGDVENDRVKIRNKGKSDGFFKM